MKSRLEPEIEIIVERYLSINLNNSQINGIYIITIFYLL